MMHSGSNHQENTENTGAGIQENLHYSKKQRAHLFSHIDNLAAGRNVTVSSTMIKVTYNKGIKDHSVTPECRNDYENKRHSISYEPSFCDDYNHKLCMNSKNLSKSFNDIVCVPDHLELTKGNGPIVKRKAQDDCQGEHPALKKKHYIRNIKKAMNAELQMNNCNVNNHLDNDSGHEVPSLYPLKQATELNLSMAVNHSIREPQSSSTPVHNEVHYKNILQNDSYNNLNDSKSIGFSEDVMSLSVNKECNDSGMIQNERLKLHKNKSEHFKKRRYTSDDCFKLNKKFKNESTVTSHEEEVEKACTNTKSCEKVDSSSAEVSEAMNEQELHKREVLQDDPLLPLGWQRIIKSKHVGEAWKPVVCLASPEGRKFYFKAKLKEYLEKTNSSLTIDDFHFGLYGRDEKTRRSFPRGNSAKKKKQEDNISQKKKTEHINSSTNVEDDDGRTQSTKTNALAQTEKNSQTVRRYRPRDDSYMEEQSLLMNDPDLPPGWVRRIRVTKDQEGTESFQVWIISPEGKKFKRKYLLHKYLIRTGSPLDISQFYFGAYPKNQFGQPPDFDKGSTYKIKVESPVNHPNVKKEQCDASTDEPLSNSFGSMPMILTKVDDAENFSGDQPMLVDPKLPPGWRRYIKVRSTGESAGKLEVILVSPDGRRHRTRGSLEQYFAKQGLDYNVDDFDFSVFGKHSQRYSSQSVNPTPRKQILKKRDSLLLPSDTSIPNLNFAHPSLVETPKSREALMIRHVSGLMVNGSLRDTRGERKLRIAVEAQEKILEKFLDTKEEEVTGEGEVPKRWIRTLVNCRSDFGTLENDAVSTIAALTKKFLCEMTKRALNISKTVTSLEYGDLAELVDQSECLSPLKSLIPKRITFSQFQKMNREKSLNSFT